MSKFESKVCTRCHGSGKYSFNLKDGDTCYGCQGTGSQFTKRGAEASRFFEESMTVLVEDLQPGQAIRFFTTDRFFNKIKLIEVGESEVIGTKHCCGHWTGEHAKTVVVYIESEKGNSTQRMPGTRVRIFHDKESKAEKLIAALAYQETLTATGRSKKR